MLGSDQQSAFCTVVKRHGSLGEKPNLSARDADVLYNTLAVRMGDLPVGLLRPIIRDRDCPEMARYLDVAKTLRTRGVAANRARLGNATPPRTPTVSPASSSQGELATSYTLPCATGR